MRPVEITPESIIQAGQELQASGRNITGFALRQKVGGGNPARLKQVWSDHARSTGHAEPVAELPSEVAEEVVVATKTLANHLAVLAAGLNAKAVKAAERRLQEVTRAAREQREQAERELADAAQAVDDAEAKLSKAADAIAALDKRLADNLASQQAQAVDLAKTRERLAMIEQVAKAMTDQMAKAQAERDSACEEAARLRGQVEILQAQANRQARLGTASDAASTERAA